MSDQFYLLKRDLYECTDHQGYTGIRDKAGVYSLRELRGVEVMPEYLPQYDGHYAIKAGEAPEFTNACFDDLARNHLKSKIADLEARLEKAEAERDGWKEARFVMGNKARNDALEEAAARIRLVFPISGQQAVDQILLLKDKS
jgi:hypothetical protein